MRSVVELVLIAFLAEATAKELAMNSVESAKTGAKLNGAREVMPNSFKLRRLLGGRKKPDIELAAPTGQQSGQLEAPSRMTVVKVLFNLIKNLVGAGMLSLPAGAAAIGGNPMLIFPAGVLVIMYGLMSSYLFYSIGSQSGALGTSTYSATFAKSVGKRSGAVVTFIVTIWPMLACLSYSIIIGDFFSALARGGQLGSWVQSHEFATDRRVWIAILNTLAIYPLCSLKDFTKLAFTSLIGNLAIVYTTVIVTLRYFDGSYRPGGHFYALLPKLTLPAISKDHSFVSALKTAFSSSGIFTMMSMCGGAFVAHVNAPLFLQTLKSDKKAFGLITCLGFGIAVLTYLMFISMGFLTFGSACNGLILNNYADSDKLAGVARALFGFAVVFTYPVIFAGLKTILKGFVPFNKIKNDALQNQAITALPVFTIAAIAILYDNAGIVTAIRGALCGATIIYIFPTIMYLKGLLPKNAIEKGGNIALLVVGSFMSVLGLYSSTKTIIAQR